jgi:hypothetical protein
MSMENTTDTKLPASPPLPAPTGSAAAQLEWLWANCTIVYWPEGGNYPIEHNPHASKYMRDIIEIYMPNAGTQQRRENP